MWRQLTPWLFALSCLQKWISMGELATWVVLSQKCFRVFEILVDWSYIYHLPLIVYIIYKIKLYNKMMMMKMMINDGSENFRCIFSGSLKEWTLSGWLSREFYFRKSLQGRNFKQIFLAFADILPSCQRKIFFWILLKAKYLIYDPFLWPILM